MSKCTNSKSWQDAKTRSIATTKKKSCIRKLEYERLPVLCKYCGKSIAYESRYNKFCSRSCAASFNNLNKIKNPKRINNHNTDPIVYAKIDIKCACCGKVMKNVRDFRKYCSEDCQHKHIHELNVNKWKINPDDMKRLSGGVRKYLIEQSNNKCSICGWGEVNQYSGNPALIVDHIDGNSEHNSPDNLRVICPNCDSLLPTYKGLNKGFLAASKNLREPM